MCILVAKHFPDIGWVGVKNRDRNYKPLIRIRQSFRKGVERLYIWDEKTKYTEGVNEYGVSILSSALAVKKDEKEGSIANPDNVYYSPDGKKIRKALLEKNIDAALKRIIEFQLPGHTLVFDSKRCILMESGFIDRDDPTTFKFKTKELKTTETIVRTNHGILLPQFGYDPKSSDPEERKANASSLNRKKLVEKYIKTAKTPDDLLAAISVTTAEKDPNLNPMRMQKVRGKRIMQTTGQLMITPKTLMLAYRPIWSEIDFDFNKLDHPDRKTGFEVISKRSLVSFKEWVD